MYPGGTLQADSMARRSPEGVRGRIRSDLEADKVPVRPRYTKGPDTRTVRALRWRHRAVSRTLTTFDHSVKVVDGVSPHIGRRLDVSPARGEGHRGRTSVCCASRSPFTGGRVVRPARSGWACRRPLPGLGRMRQQFRQSRQGSAPEKLFPRHWGIPSASYGSSGPGSIETHVSLLPTKEHRTSEQGIGSGSAGNANGQM